MAKFGHAFISGVLWVLIAVGIGLGGLWIVDASGLWAVLGWIIALIAFAFAGMSFMQLFRVASLTRQGLRMMEEDPDRFEEAQRRFDEAKHRTDQGQ